MMRLWGALVISAVGLNMGPASAAAHPPVNDYQLGHPAREHCRAHYVRRPRTSHRRIHGRRIAIHQTFCVRIKPAAPVGRPRTPAKPVLHARLDPSFTQSPTNPLAVTYAYSASAIEGTAGSGIRPAPLPSGILDLYSDGSLKCSMNVGGTATGGSCLVTYSAFGAHRVIVDYISGDASATETDTEQIDPFATSTTLLLQGPSECESESTSPETESCTYVAEVATLDQNGNAPREGEEVVAIEKSPEQEFTPAVVPGKLLLPGPGFPGPIAFKLQRSHVEGGWVCSLRYGSVIEWFGGLGFPYPTPCGTTMAAYARFDDVAGSWGASRTVSQPVVF